MQRVPDRLVYAIAGCVLAFLVSSPLAAQSADETPGAASGTGTAQSVPEEPTSADAPGEAALESVTEWISSLGIRSLIRENSFVDWLILLIAIVLGLVIGRLIAHLFGRIAGKLEEAGQHIRSAIFTDSAGPLNLMCILIGMWIGISPITMRADLRSFAIDLIALLFYIAIFWWAYNLVQVLEIALRRITSATRNSLDDMLLPMIRKALRIFIVVVGLLLIAENVFGQDMGAWLAGLGIAGLAVSLAAQDSLKNLFGSVTILLDRPFRLGDRINFAGHDGPVEEIGFRSIKVRTLTGHLVTVPNSKIVNETVENIGARPYIRRLFNVTITYDTPPDKIELAVDTIRSILEEGDIAPPIHGKVGDDEFPPRVYFNELNADSLNIIVIYWFFPPAYWDYLEHAQRVNIRIMRELSARDIDFAFPSHTVYLAKDEKRVPEVMLRTAVPAPGTDESDT